MRTMIFSAILLAGLSGVAIAQTDPNAPPVQIQQGTAVVQDNGQVVPGEEAGDERPDPDAEVICRVIQESGSRLARRRQRVCGTRTMWETMQDRNAHDMQGPVVQGQAG